MSARLTEKVCPYCGSLKPRADFGEKKPGFIRDRCRFCAAEQARRWRQANASRHREAKKAARAKNPASHLAYNANWNKTDRGKLVMRIARRVQRAIARGALVRPDRCEQCGSTGRIDAAHYDYGRPLEVRWLCRFCHARWDHEQPKSRGIGRWLYPEMRGEQSA